MLRRKISMVVLVIVFTFLGGRSNGIYGGKLLNSGTLKFLTYNVSSYNYRHTRRVNSLISVIRNSNADIIALQEVSSWFLKRLLQEGWIRNEYYGILFPSSKTPYGGLYTFSRYPIEKVICRYLPSKAGRRALITHIRYKDCLIAIANVHLDSPLEDNYLRAKQLNIVFKELADSKHSVLLGDYNFGDNEQPESSFLNKEYRDIWLDLKPGKAGFTWDMSNNILARINAYKGERSRRIDRIMVRSELMVPYNVEIVGQSPVVYHVRKNYIVQRKYRVKKKIKIKTGNKFRWKYVTKWRYGKKWKFRYEKRYEFPSDHFGLTGTVRIPEKAESYAMNYSSR